MFYITYKKLTTIKRNKLEVFFFHYISVLNCLSWNEQKTDDQIGIQAPQTAIEQTSNSKRYLGNQNSYILYSKARFHLKQFYFQ
jgi:hypothetical protein